MEHEGYNELNPFTSLTDDDIIHKVKSGDINYKSLVNKLTEFIDLADVDQVFEYSSSTCCSVIDQPLDFHPVPLIASRDHWRLEHSLFGIDLIK